MSIVFHISKFGTKCNDKHMPVFFFINIQALAIGEYKQYLFFHTLDTLQCTTVKPLYSEQSRDPNKCSLYRGVHPRGVRYVHAHMCLKYNVHILKLFRSCLKGLVRWQSHFPREFFLFTFYDFIFYTGVQYMYFS